MSEGTIEMRPTMNFRWVKTGRDVRVFNYSEEDLADELRLQQQFINTATGQTEWRDVPVLEVEES